MKKGKLELTWVGKDERVRLEPRVLVEDASKSYGDPNNENMLIFGDNLLALKALEQDFAETIQCIYIDPPFNIGAAFEHYDDNLEHSLWLSLMRQRLEILHNLLSPSGLIFIQIDYREGARLKVLLDEVFGPACFKNEIIVRRGTKNVQSQFDTIDALATGHDTIYLYAKNSTTRLLKLQAFSEESDPGKWDTFWRGTDRPTMRFECFGIKPEKGQWRWGKDRALSAKKNYEEYLSEHSDMSLDDYYGLQLHETGVEMDFIRLGPENTVQYYVAPRNYKILSDVWMDVRTSGKITSFEHEKHEELVERIIRWNTKPNDWVLDSFSGSGTTGAVAHKMGRKWIMCELGEHCHTHIIPRMKAVIDGEQGGISKAVNWKGGGGFKYYRLAESLLVQDKDLSSKDHPVFVINPRYDAKMLVRAICKIENFRYRNQGRLHGVSSENRFLHVTTQLITQKYIDSLAADIGPNQSLLIYSTRMARGLNLPPNVEIKKIPRDLLAKCDFQEEK